VDLNLFLLKFEFFERKSSSADFKFPKREARGGEKQRSDGQQNKNKKNQKSNNKKF
jgi:hypothetical protein